MGEVKVSAVLSGVTPLGSIASSGAALVNGTAVKTLGNLSISSSGEVVVIGLASATTGPASLASSIESPGQSLDPLTLAATGTATVGGILQQSLESADLTSTADARLDRLAALELTLKGLQISSTGSSRPKPILTRSTLQFLASTASWKFDLQFPLEGHDSVVFTGDGIDDLNLLISRILDSKKVIIRCDVGRTFQNSVLVTVGDVCALRDMYREIYGNVNSPPLSESGRGGSASAEVVTA